MPKSSHWFTNAAASALKLPIYAYRYSFAFLLGGRCRHHPSCSQYALEAIEINGAWRGFWLGFSRVLRCHPWGTDGHDPAPDLRGERHPIWAAWRYGRWRRSHLQAAGGKQHDPIA